MENPKQRARGREIGKSGLTVAANLKILRGEMSFRQLEGLMEELGVKISASGLQKIESGERRVDADEILALSIALNVNPNALLLPNYSGDVDMSDDVTAVAEGTTGADIWAWADGWEALPQHRTDAPEVDESATGMERGRQEARRRRVTKSWDFLGRVRPQGEASSRRKFIGNVREKMEALEPGEWLTLWRHSKQQGLPSFQVAEYPSFFLRGAQDVTESLERIKAELSGMLESPNYAHVLDEVLKARKTNGHD